MVVQGIKINEVKWINIIKPNDDVNVIYNKINEKFSKIYKNSYKINKYFKKRSTNPWINDELIKQCEMRDELFKRCKNNPNNTNLEREYKKYRNRLNKN